MNHLNDDARDAVILPTPERIYFLQRDQWIGYAAADEGLEELEFLFNHPKIDRMPNRLVLSQTNNGKTALVRRFMALHGAINEPGDDAAVVPIIMVQAPPVPDERRFYASILDEIGMVHRPRQKTAELFYQVRTLLPKLALKMIIIDEIHNIISGDTKRHQAFLNTIKYLGNELKIPIVIVGTDEALKALRKDRQVANRFPPVELPLWECDNELRNFLACFERTLPLKCPSNLSDMRMTKRLHSMSEGTVGELSLLLKAATREAIRGGEERICDAVLDRLRWLPYSHREKHALAVI